ncbi:SigE family RNA polymerase sigma factor [Nocardioides panzhihuensis]|uniref:RNA polymerase sigma-70 factor (Sigma-E family) n=1 Tax=Nocardioides panzhihuensis TaxID=860243 RepID=A0A7Z0DNW5_9ACTN|nr:SigE family RNA polymerase sigma factor [Nocardioides panzhihuensis]NYI78687.1 RNA polymerase sigma-70 factor (sigma-E family) [Nocardioides panzhihuensis]
MDTDFDEYVVTRSGALLRLAYLLTGDGHRAEDLVQDTLERLCRRWSRMTYVADPHAYARKILLNQHLSWRRKRASSELVVADLPERAGEDETEAVGVRHLLWQRIGALPPRQRAVVVLRYYEDLADADIAEALGISAGTVRSNAMRALTKLRTHPDLMSTTLAEETR